MKIDLTQLINADLDGTKSPLRFVFKDALFNSKNASNRHLYDKINVDEAEVDLKIEEWGDIQKACRERGIKAGIQWQVDDIINQKTELKKEK